MPAPSRFALLVLALACMLWQTGLRAQDKKDPPKQDGPIVVNDQLFNFDAKDKLRTQCFCKTYIFKMTEGKKYQIDMTSPNFDSYLRVENKAGQQVAADDDGGGYPSARIIYLAPKTEDFTIIATTFSGGATGKFTVTVKEVPK